MNDDDVVFCKRKEKKREREKEREREINRQSSVKIIFSNFIQHFDSS